MFGQSSRFLTKLYRKVMKGKRVAFPFAYLNDLTSDLQSLRSDAQSVDDFLNIDLLERALALRALNLIQSTMADYDASNEPSKVKDNDVFYQAKVTMTRAHLKYLQFFLFRESYKNHSFLDNRIVSQLDTVSRIFCLSDLIEENSCGALFDTGFLQAGSLRFMNRALEKAVADLRPQMVPLAESLYLPDHWMISVIGNKEGDIYEMQLNEAMKTRLNKDEVPEYFERLMKPILRAKL